MWIGGRRGAGTCVIAAPGERASPWRGSSRVQDPEREPERGIDLEDDYDGELRHHGAPLPLPATVGPDVVVHLGTASKILTPTLGVGWMAAPAEVAAAVRAHRSDTGVRPSPAGQRVRTALLARPLGPQDHRE